MRRGVGLAMAALLAAAPARAEVKAGEAAALTAALRGWVAGLLPTLIEAASVPLTMLPDGDRYRLELMPGSSIPGLALTSSGPAVALLRPLDDTRWAIEEFRLPTDFSAVVSLGDPGAGGGRFTMHIAEQRVSGEIDTSLAMPSRISGSYAGISQTLEGPRGPQTITVGKATAEALWTPVGGSVMNASSLSVMEDYASQQAMPGEDRKLIFSVAKVATTLRAEAVDLARIRDALRTAAALVSDIRAELAGKAPGQQQGPSPEQRAALHELLESVAESFSRVEGRQELTGLHFSLGEVTGELARAELGSAIGAPGGNAELRLSLALEGLESPQLPAGGVRGLLPRRIAITPRISGVPKSTLVGFLAHAIDVAGDQDAELEEEARQLLADNPLTIGIDGLTIELGVAKLTGSGQLQVASATDMTGAAELRMRGFDALIRLLGQLPEARVALPVAVMMKGIGKIEGDDTVWRIAYRDGSATVNGTDLSALVPGGRRR